MNEGRPSGRLPLPLGVAVAISFLFSVAVLTFRTSSGALHHYTDHQRHAAYAFAALERGPAVYLATNRELLAHSAFRHPTHEWLDGGYPYPPGPLLLFIPVALIGQETSISTGAFHRLCGSVAAFLAHVGLWFALGRLLVLPRGWKLLAGVMLWAYCLRCSLCAQYEPLWLAPAACMLAALQAGRREHALGWLALAWMTHARAVVLLPFGVLAAVQLLRSANTRRWSWVFLAGAAAAVCGVCILITLSRCGVHPDACGHTHPRFDLPLYATPTDGRMALVILATLGGIALAVLAGDRVLGAAVALIGLTGIFDVAHWWHVSGIYVPLISRDAAARWRRPVAATVGFLVWAMAMRFVWLDRPLGLLHDLSGALAAPLERPSPR